MTIPIKFRCKDLTTGKIIGYEWLQDNKWCFLRVGQKDINRSEGVFHYTPFRREQLGAINDAGDELYEGCE